jgi:hypothetical protein
MASSQCEVSSRVVGGKGSTIGGGNTCGQRELACAEDTVVSFCA